MHLNLLAGIGLFLKIGVFCAGKKAFTLALVVCTFFLKCATDLVYISYLPELPAPVSAVSGSISPSENPWSAIVGFLYPVGTLLFTIYL